MQLLGWLLMHPHQQLGHRPFGISGVNDLSSVLQATWIGSLLRSSSRPALAGGSWIYSPSETTAGVRSSELGTSFQSLSFVALSNKSIGWLSGVFLLVGLGCHSEARRAAAATTALVGCQMKSSQYDGWFVCQQQMQRRHGGATSPTGRKGSGSLTGPEHMLANRRE